MSKQRKKRAIRDLDNPGTAQPPQPQTSARPTNQPRAAKTPAKATTSANATKRAANPGNARRQQPTAPPVPRPGYVVSWWRAVDGFWFTPRSPKMLGLIRFLTGLIGLYTLAVWTPELTTFFANDGLLPLSYRSDLGAVAAWSHLDLVADSPTNLLVVHIVGMIVMLAFTAGAWTRVTAVLAAAMVIGYSNRSIGAGFGLDQILTFLCLYCAVGNAGGAFSVDRWLTRRRDQSAVIKASTTTNIAVRLIQIHLCVVYFFAAIGKLQGQTWWTGEAVWLAMSSYEYQQVDMTWLAKYLPLVSLLTIASLFWELFYAALVWPRLTRPIMLAVAVPMHLGIGICLGMMEFGLVMLIANLAFVEAMPRWRQPQK